MAHISSITVSESPVSVCVNTVATKGTFVVNNQINDRHEVLLKNYYFDNEAVERLMCQYKASACTDIAIRDAIMEHASELINQIIKAHNLAQIYPGRDESSMMDLFQTAWLQIEMALYKYEAYPHCGMCYNNTRPADSMLCLADDPILNDDKIWDEDFLIKKFQKCRSCGRRLMRGKIYYRGKSKIFNLLSQVARTVILAYIKKEGRDRKNSEIFKTHLGNQVIQQSATMLRFFGEIRELSKGNKQYLAIVDALEELYRVDDKVHDGLVVKLMKQANVSKAVVVDFMNLLRCRSRDITDSPLNKINCSMKNLFDDRESIHDCE